MKPAYYPHGRSSQTLRTRRLLIAATAVSVALAFIPIAQSVWYPLRLLITLVHEAGHGVVTVLTGGAVQYITVSPAGSGLTLSEGGAPFFIYMAGYVGTSVCGATCLVLGARSGRGRSALVLMGGITLAITLLWVRNGFGLLAGVAMASMLLAAARFLPSRGSDLLAAFLSVQLCLNAVTDLNGLVTMTAETSRANDAVFMARAFGMTPWFWAILWAGMGITIVALALRAAWRGVS